MDLYFNRITHILYILKSDEIKAVEPPKYLWESVKEPELIKVEKFDIDNIESAYNILYIHIGHEITVNCIENIDQFKEFCNSFCNPYGDAELTDSDFEYSEENNSTKLRDAYTVIIYFENLEIENNCFLK